MIHIFVIQVSIAMEIIALYQINIQLPSRNFNYFANELKKLKITSSIKIMLKEKNATKYETLVTI